MYATRPSVTTIGGIRILKGLQSVCEMSAKVTITVTDTGFWNFWEKFAAGGRELLFLPLDYFKMDMGIAKLTTGGIFTHITIEKISKKKVP